MGVDFIRRTAKTFEKSWDRHRVLLSTPDLFTRQPQGTARSVAADLVPVSGHGRSINPGDIVTVQEAQPNDTNCRLIALSGLSVVARFVDPPPEVVDAVRESFGVARGTIERIHAISGVVEISLC